MLYCIPYGPSSVMITSVVQIKQEAPSTATGSVARALAWDRGEVPSLLTLCATSYNTMVTYSADIGIKTTSSYNRPTCFVPELVAGSASVSLT